ncbi:MAG: UDP-3-O-(3-hydroxymyristoyl)glucosamine N-acyltransferase [Gammaproteobacteria bacterium]|nr:MAG: UDP-3-O-(3-hydroxymyristoyl)glucosamine N-acyltransferase [Gammaproteobacteria bacterium]
MLTLEALARHIGAELRGDGAAQVAGLNTLGAAGPDEVAFLANPAYAGQLETTRALAVIVSPDMADKAPTNVLVMGNPYLGYALASQIFGRSAQAAEGGVHPAAVLAEDAQLGEGCTIGPNVVIEAGARIGAGSRIGPGCHIGAGAVIGKRARLYPGVTLYHGVTLGDDVIVHSGAVIGSDGFGFAPAFGDLSGQSSLTDLAPGFHKIEQLGGVRIGNQVEIGANTTIDRGALDDTVIEDGVKLDNQIQIAHNVRIGAHTVMAACSGVAGSTEIGRHCMIGGGVGIAGHLKICDGVQITGMTLVSHSISEPGTYSSGTAVEPNSQWRRNVARFRQLDKLARKVSALEKTLREMETPRSSTSED